MSYEEFQSFCFHFGIYPFIINQKKLFQTYHTHKQMSLDILIRELL